MLPVTCRSTLVIVLLNSILHVSAAAQQETGRANTSSKPQLFLVGDSLMQTGRGDGDSGPWGWASEIGAYFDSKRIEVINAARGGRSSRSYINEGLWASVLERLDPGDFVIVGFGHNDIRGSKDHPTRATITGAGDQTIRLGVSTESETVHTYGWYLRKYAGDAQEKGAGLIICSPVPRRTWKDGNIIRGFDGYAAWAEEAARMAGVPFINLNARVADVFEAMGEETAREHYNDLQHTNKRGAKIVANVAVEGLRSLAPMGLQDYLLPD